MMGEHSRSEALFYYFRLEDQIPENHLLRLIDKHISFEFVRQRLKDSYSETGRPSIDPELLLRILLIGYLYGITSERKLVEELRMYVSLSTLYVAGPVPNFTPLAELKPWPMIPTPVPTFPDQIITSEANGLSPAL